MELTDRDAHIIRAIHRHRFLRSHQIAELIGGSRQQILRRLQLLFHHRYLERPLCQIDYFQNLRSRSIVYGLGTRGAGFLRRVDNIPFRRLDWSPRNGSVKRLFLEHALMISDIMVALDLAYRNCTDVRLLMDDEIPLPPNTHSSSDPFRWKARVRGGGQIGVIPDKVFVLETSRGTGSEKERIMFCLEADRGTMPVARSSGTTSCFARKLRAYADTWRQQIHRSRFGCSRFRVLAITTTNVRADHLCMAARKLESGAGVFLFATLSQLLSRDNASDFLLKLHGSRAGSPLE